MTASASARRAFLLAGACAALHLAPVAAAPPPAATAGPDTVTVAFVGDVLLHDSLQIQAAEHGPQGGHHTLWRRVRDGLAAADITYANLEGPVAKGLRCDGRLSAAPPAVSYAKGGCGPGNGDAVYTGYPLFNYPPALLDALAGAGVDVVSTANNHALDRRALGVDMTVDALAARGIAYAGTRRSDGPAAFHALTEVRSPRGRMRLAWLACTYGTNGLVDGLAQVTPCYDDQGSPWPPLLAATRDLALQPAVDAVIVTPHWGAEYRHTPHPSQERLARELTAAGATAVVGAHPHVVQPMAMVSAGGREAFVAYSLGNFVADQPDPATRVGLLLYLDLVRSSDGEVVAGNPRYVPLFMARAEEAGPWRRTLVALTDDVPGAAAREARAVVLSVLEPAWRGALEAPRDPGAVVVPLAAAAVPARVPPPGAGPGAQPAHRQPVHL